MSNGGYLNSEFPCIWRCVKEGDFGYLKCSKVAFYPLVFLICIWMNWVWDCMSGVGARLAGKAMNHLRYADDLCFLTMSSKGMPTLLQLCEEYATEHDLVYNGAKSVCILFRAKGFRSPVADLILAGNRLLYVNSHSYLGVMIEVGKCELDIKRQLMKFYAIQTP